MSRKIPEQEYEKTLSFRLKQWFEGTKDPFVDTVEMKPQKEVEKDENIDWKRKREKRQRIEKIYDLAHNWEIRSFQGFYKVFSGVFCLFLVAMLLIAVSYLPSYGHPENPANNEVAERYIESGLEETGAVNIVTGMILDYRAFDTLGESHVLFIATCTVLILLRKDRKDVERKALSTNDAKSAEAGTGCKDENGKDIEVSDRIYEPKNDVILQTAARVLVPPIIIFGIYVILGGHLGPGGGFSGGAIIGAGLILYLNAFGFQKTERFFTSKTYKILSVSALGCYCLAKSYSFYTGANHIESIIPLGTPGAILSSGLILILNICVGIVVAGTMYTFYVMFRKGGY